MLKVDGELEALRILTVRPRDIAGKTRRRIAAEELAELTAVVLKIKKATAELKAMVLARNSRLMELPGVGPVAAARILADVGDISRFASWTGKRHWTPPPASRTVTASPGPATGGSTT